MNQKNTNIKYISGVSQYLVNSDDEILNVDSTAMAITIILPNIRDWQLLFAKPKRVITINDAGGNAGTNAITVIANGNNINGEGSLLLDADKDTATFFPVDNNEWFGDKQPSGGGSMTTANNGLTVNAGIVQLGGSLILPTTITSSFANMFELVDGFGSLIKSRDSDYNVSWMDYGGNTNTNSQHITSYISIGNTYTDSNIILNFGSIGVYNLAVDVFNFGDYTTVTNSNIVNNIGRSNTVASSVSVNIFGNSNTLTTFSNVTVIGSGNTLSSLSDLFIIGNNNKNIFVDGSTGYLGVNISSTSASVHVKGAGATSATYSLKVVNSSSINLLSIKNDGSAKYGTNGFELLAGGLAASMNGLFPIYGGTGNSFEAGNIGVSGDIGIYGGINFQASGFSKIYGNGNYGIIYSSTGGDVLHDFRGNMKIKGSDATSSNYSLKIDNSALSPLLYVRNDGNIGIGVTSPGTKLEVNGDIKITSKANLYKIGSYDALSISQSVGSPNIIIGHSNTMNDASNGGGVVIGCFATSSSDGIAIGLSAFVGINTEDGIAIGRNATVSTGVIRGLAIGRDSAATADNAFAIGNYVVASNPDTIIFGANTSGNKQKVGMGTINPTATAHVKGVDATSSNYALKVDDSAGTKLFHVRNDARYIFNDSPLTMPDGGTASYGLKSGAYNWYFYTSETFLTDGTVSYSEQLGANYACVGTYSNHAFRIRTNNADRAIFNTSGGLNMASLPTSNAGLSTGDFYVDTAANILSNGDKVVGWKV